MVPLAGGVLSVSQEAGEQSHSIFVPAPVLLLVQRRVSGACRGPGRHLPVGPGSVHVRGVAVGEGEVGFLGSLSPFPVLCSPSNLRGEIINVIARAAMGW